MHPGQADRRKSIRKEVLAPAVMQIEADGRRFTSQAIVKNLSLGGLQVALYDYDDDLRKLDLTNSHGAICFRFSGGSREYRATCQTIRVEKWNYTIQIGAMFTDMSESQRRSLEDICASA
ncbi:PilZ domain-containing protein [Desulfonatronum thiodismutans]|uniref:PilZ domain-containing protein n=1 Tax=Desulfonatronum thiodismutans TaxID=159290 RepID=UPI0009FBB7D4|nr:PilZ domain-containing protein [Desulfonatronum thiodismutans]